MIRVSFCVIGNLGHDILLAFDTNRHGAQVLDLDLALHLLVNSRGAGEVSGGVRVDLLVEVVGQGGPARSTRTAHATSKLFPLCVVDVVVYVGGRVPGQLAGAGAVAGGGACRAGVDQGPGLTETTRTLPRHLTVRPVQVVVGEVGNVLEVAGRVLVTARGLGLVGLHVLVLARVDLPVHVTMRRYRTKNDVLWVYH